jgi:hypothetical protein
VARHPHSFYLFQIPRELYHPNDSGHTTTLVG